MIRVPVKKADEKDEPAKPPHWRTILLQVLLASLVASPAIITAIQISRTQSKVDVVHDLVNSRLTELLELTRKNSRAEGVKEGRAENP